MSYCKYGPDSDVYVYASTWYPDERPCWVLLTTADEYPREFFSRQDIYDHLLALRDQGRRIPEAALARLREEMEVAE